MESNEYFKRCLETNTVGDVTKLTPELRQQYENWVDDEDLLLHQALNQLRQKRHFEYLDSLDSEDEKLAAFIGGELPPVHLYRVRYDLGFDQQEQELDEADFSEEDWNEICVLAAAQKKKFLEALEVGEIDERSPLEAARRLWFQKRVDEFDADDHPESIPQVFEEGCCNVFGHICPVFFAAEGMTETEQERRIGRRNLPFATMMRIVRRDDYRCQHCKEPLKDDQVEFDHIIPVSKGGSSEEHNLRLTCYDCNRDKRDDYSP